MGFGPGGLADVVDLAIVAVEHHGHPLLARKPGAQAFPAQVDTLNHIAEPVEPPRISPARAAPVWDDPPIDAVPDWDALAQPQPE